MPKKKPSYGCTLCKQESTKTKLISCVYETDDGKHGITLLLVCEECIDRKAQFTIDNDGRATLIGYGTEM